MSFLGLTAPFLEPTEEDNIAYNLFVADLELKRQETQELINEFSEKSDLPADFSELCLLVGAASKNFKSSQLTLKEQSEVAQQILCNKQNYFYL